jgi:hypothetical protein
MNANGANTFDQLPNGMIISHFVISTTPKKEDVLVLSSQQQIQDGNRGLIRPLNIVHEKRHRYTRVSRYDLDKLAKQIMQPLLDMNIILIEIKVPQSRVIIKHQARLGNQVDQMTSIRPESRMQLIHHHPGPPRLLLPQQHIAILIKRRCRSAENGFICFI